MSRREKITRLKHFFATGERLPAPIVPRRPCDCPPRYSCSNGCAAPVVGGTFPTRAKCLAACGSAPCLDQHAYTLLSFTNKTGGCTCLPDTPLIGGAGTGDIVTQWPGTTTCEGNYGYALHCTDGQYRLEVQGVGYATLVSYTPGTIVYDLPFLLACGGSARAIVTD